MRGKSSSAIKARLRSAGYKCNLCGRRLIDAATLERHQKLTHNITKRENTVSFKAKPPRPPPIIRKSSNKEKEKVFTNLRKEHIIEQSRPKRSKNNNESRDTAVKDLGEQEMISDKKIDLIENGEITTEKGGKGKKKVGKNARQIHFVCPACGKMFGVYFNAHRHIQSDHSDVPKLRPVRVEPCCRCNCKIRSDQEHKCRKVLEEPVSEIAEYVCSGCNQIFVSLKSFDLHVAGLHSDAVDSMFFPSKLEFVTWRLEMESQTNSKYLLYGEYESKKIYRCNYARNDALLDRYTAYFCPSSMVVQEFTKGIQVHYYHKHFDHTTNAYTLTNKYRKYFITSFLSSKSSNEESSAAVDSQVKLHDKELYSQFKKLMDSIVTNSAELDTAMLKNLIDKALEMSAIVTDAAVSETGSILKPAKSMSDKEISEALETKADVSKRRRSVDSCELPSKPAKRIRNKSLFNQSPTKLSPKIVNTFSLASNSNSEEFKSDNGDEVEFDLIKSDSTDKVKSNKNKNAPESDTTTNKYMKMNTRLSSRSESLSFNDSYKDFIDKNFIGSKGETKSKNKVKTKLGAFKQISPRKAENKEDTSDMLAVNRGMKPIASRNPKIEEAPETIDTEKPKLNILSIETPNLTISKVNSGKTDTPKVNMSKKKGFSHLVDPLQINITKANRGDSTSPVETFRGNVSTRNTSPALVDPLELNISKTKPRSVSKIAPSQRNIAKVDSKTSTSLMNQLNVNATKTSITTLDAKVNTRLDPGNTAHKVYSGPGTPKVGSPGIRTPKAAPKVSFEDNVPSPSNAKLTPQKKIPELKYEVREQENDCNILILKF